MNKRVVDLAEQKSRDAMYNDFSGITKAITFEKTDCRVDGHMTGRTDTRSVFENKLRDIPSDKYEEIMIEKIKWDALLYYKELTNEDLALYINIFQDKDVVWDISSLPEPKWEKKYCTATTAEDYGKKKVEKVVGFLKKEDALWIRDRLLN